MHSSNDLFNYLVNLWEWIGDVKVTHFDNSQERLHLPYNNYLFIVGAIEIEWYDFELEQKVRYCKTNGSWHLNSEGKDVVTEYFN